MGFEAAGADEFVDAGLLEAEAAHGFVHGALGAYDDGRGEADDELVGPAGGADEGAAGEVELQAKLL